MSLGERIAAQEREQEERTPQEQPERAEASAAPDSVVNDTGSHEYYLVEEDGRVTIYRIEGQTLFEYTGHHGRLPAGGAAGRDRPREAGQRRKGIVRFSGELLQLTLLFSEK